MRLVVYGPERRVGILSDDSVIDANAAYACYLKEVQDEALPFEVAAGIVPGELGLFIAADQRALEGSEIAVTHAKSRLPNTLGLRGEKIIEPLSEVKLHPPLAKRARLFMAGSNYPVHTRGAARNPGEPEKSLEEVRQGMRDIGIRGFIGFTENAIATGEAIVYPDRTDRLDYEGEIAVVIGKAGSDIKAGDAIKHFWGYMLMNDTSARTSLPKPDNAASRFARDKNFDSSKSAGPYVVVGELPDPQDISWETRVNGEIRQQGNTKDMAFSFGEMLEHLSEDMTFYPGDVISAGTTGGTAVDSSEILDEPGNDRNRRPKRDPKLFLKPGDVVEVSNPLLGLLQNPVVAKR